MKILIVDDSKLARMAVAKALNVHYPDWGRIEAANADDAIASAREADIALLDFNMPGRDGLALAAELRATKPAMPVAIISANHQQEIVQRAHAIGATFLQKPLTEQALSEFLSSAIQKLKAGAK
ncbi:MAG TPA: response regulator [Rhizomicrobium sp.]|jgi:DNA-binding NarL/FixJ family response regulator|nr:response regulator [Rhizomicrobium sp.]